MAVNLVTAGEYVYLCEPVGWGPLVLLTARRFFVSFSTSKPIQ